MLIAQLKGKLQNAIRSVLRSASHEDREDALQEAFLRIFTKLNTWDRTAPFCEWAKHIAIMYCIDEIRKHKVRSSARSTQAKLTLSSRQAPTPAVQACMQEVIDQMPSKYQEVYRLTFDGTSPKEIAGIVGKSVECIYKWINSIYYLLSNCLER